MNLERMNHLIAILQRVHDTQQAFDLGSWLRKVGADSDDDFDEEPGRIYGEIDPVCGTVACAYGYAALDPAFQAQGLSLMAYTDQHVPFAILKAEDFLRSDMHIKEAYPIYTVNGERVPLHEFFGISDHAFNYCFMPSFYSNEARGPLDVIAHLREVIANDDYSPSQQAAAESEA